MANRLEVELGAQIKELQSKLSKAQKDLSSFDKTADKNLTKFSKSANTSAKSVGNLQKGVVRGDNAMLAFSRTVQDAPFGMMGISNNITNLTEQFGYLKARTGSAGTALKSMISSLSGFGGITLLISLATSAWLVYGDKITEAFNSTAKLKKETKALTEATKGLMGTVGKEISTLNVLLKVARDETISKGKREKAIKKINELYPDYLGNLTLEGVNSKTTTTQVEALTKALIKQATVKGLLSRISEIATKKFDAEQKTAEEYVGVTDKIGSAFAFLFSTNEKYTTAFGKGSKARKKAIGDEEKKIESLQDTISKLLKDNELDFDKLFGGSSGGKGGTGIKAKVFIDEIEVADDNAILEQIDLNIGDDWGFIDWSKYFALSAMDEQRKLLAQKLEALNNEAGNIIGNSLVGTFSGIGRAIGEAMANGTNLAQGLGRALLGGIGGMLTQLGQMAIGVGIGIKAIKTALKTLNPAVAIGAGIGLIALGSAFSASASKIADSGGGGSTNAGANSTSGGSSFNGGSSGGFGGGTVVFEISGQKLVGVLSNTLERNRNLGGSLGII